jgi:crotonobetainyl-CoA:carnitine CoA-transferase CaiB-like acyl-CoA transferase
MAPETMRQRDWDQFNVVTVTQEEVEQLEEAIAAFFLTLTKREFFEGAVARRMLGYPVGTARDIAEDPQLKARDAWQDVLDPTVEGPVRYPGGFARFDGSAPRIRCPAPGVGAHNRQVFGELGLQAQDLAPLTGAGVL